MLPTTFRSADSRSVTWTFADKSASVWALTGLDLSTGNPSSMTTLALRATVYVVSAGGSPLVAETLAVIVFFAESADLRIPWTLGPSTQRRATSLPSPDRRRVT